jgi:flagellar biosynthetic protein FliR
MRGELSIPLSTLMAFAFVLARVAGTFTFVPLPGAHAGPSMPRIVLAFGCTLALMPQWPAVDVSQMSAGNMLAIMLTEAALGISAGVLVALVSDALAMAAQIVGLQAGYGYASTIDPTTQADSGVLLVIAQLCAGLLFFAFGLERQLLHAFASSIAAHPPGSYYPGLPVAEQIIKAMGTIFSVGLRLAFPVMALLLMVDIGLAVIGRLNAQAQFLSLAFTAKMFIGLLLLAATLIVYPSIYQHTAADALGLARAVLTR